MCKLAFAAYCLACVGCGRCFRDPGQRLYKSAAPPLLAKFLQVRGSLPDSKSRRRGFLSLLLTSMPSGSTGGNTRWADVQSRARNTIDRGRAQVDDMLANVKREALRLHSPGIKLPRFDMNVSWPIVGVNERLLQLQTRFAPSIERTDAPPVDAEKFVKDATSSDPSWELKVDSADGTRVWRRKVFGSRSSDIRGNAILEASPKDVDELMQCPNEQVIRLYNPMYDSGYDIETLDPETRISYGIARTIKPFKPRDTVTRVAHRKLKDGSTVLILHAVEHKAAPRRPDCVRARVIRGMYLMQPISSQPDRTNFTFTQQIDVGAMVPGWLMDKVITKDSVQFLKRLGRTSAQWESNRYCTATAL